MGWLLLLAGCGQVEHSLSGNTMGTTYHIKVVAPRSEKMAPVQKAVDAMLEAINDSMSTYRPESEISRFNRFGQTGTPFPISAHFLRVMLTGREIHSLTSGAWDGTINPLVELWGFGRNTVPEHTPPEGAIHQALARVGFDRIEVGVNGTLSKKQPDVTVDLASIAKGYAVDQVALLLRGRGYRQFLVEIGGEIYAAGMRPDDKPWKVGINQPDKGAALNAVYKVVPLNDMAMATSGDYRNFYEIDGQTYSHIIDPRTGRPVQNGVVSASVVADNCTLADGLATALMVMGPQQGIALLERLPGVDGLIVVRNADGRLENFGSHGF
jgi:thiamine biosynthesis lipoprotein